MSPGLYDARFEHDGCGVGFAAELDGRPGPRALPLALTALVRLAHRGAVAADGRTGDGAGVMTQVPHAVLRPALEARGHAALPARDLAVGLLFLPRQAAAAERCRRIAEDTLAAEGLGCLGWREVPLREEALGDTARRSRPALLHLLASRPVGATDDGFERSLYRARRALERRATLEGLDGLYVASLSHRTLVYKALVRGLDLAAVFPDLRDPAFATAFAVFHQRFSTNTAPAWAMAQPFHLLAHNGEINTVQGNRLWMRARQVDLREDASDSASLDEALGLLRHGGRGLLHAMAMLMPPAWENDAQPADGVRAFFDYHAALMEPWDGPALVAFSDGQVVGAALDRNGLRPARYTVTGDGLLLLASEAGAFDVPPERVLHQERLGPGGVLALDLRARRVFDRAAAHRALAARRPYAAWVRAHRVAAAPGATADDDGEAAPPGALLRAFGYTREELRLVLGPMFEPGVEPVGSMGDDTALSVLTDQPRLLFSYFKQRFAQVTNPAIDPLRESIVLSLDVRLGPRLGLFDESPRHAAQAVLPSPVIDGARVAALEATPGWRSRRLSLLWPAAAGPAGLASALEDLIAEAAAAVRDGAALLVLTDEGVDPARAALPSLLAVSAVHQHLVREGLRLRASLVVDTREARDEHHLAALVAYGAEAVCPSLALALARESARRAGLPAGDVEARYRRTLEKGLLKVMAKMGISTVRSYHGSQLMEAVGIGPQVIGRHFTGTPSLVGGMELMEIAREALHRHYRAWGAEGDQLPEGSLHRYRQKGERHAFEPAVVKALHAALASGRRMEYREYAELVRGRAPIAVRDLLDLAEAEPVPLEEVEPAALVARRFYTAAMSLGALGPEAQQALAVAMNRLGARSNSGEGGEPPELFAEEGGRGDRAHNRVKQVASARFGVTARYLVSADELQIKIAQGSKPGEGGQLPGHKVVAHIARVRHAPPGITLISPPPHHDIYSIEDLAQLVHDLRRVNPRATVGVKLAAEAGVGQVAAGVAKAGADAIVIAGHDGGTGASPLGSIKNVGTPWELGLAEAQQVLARNGLRARVRLQVEGGLKTGRDVVIAALLGADEFGFGSAALVAAGCVMARQCHLNTCPAGIATQREDLRRRFSGRPEDVVRFFLEVAEEVREILALLGYRRLQEAVGRVERLAARGRQGDAKASVLDLSGLLWPPAPGEARGWSGQGRPPDPPHLDDVVLRPLRSRRRGPRRLTLSLRIGNADRSVGAAVAGELARRYVDRPVPPGTVRLRYRGSAGQSFGAFCAPGMQLVLEGEANDGLGKGMSGGEIVVRPARPDLFGVVAGNAILYGATGGAVFLAGRVGERFAVRNSGALAVVEGAGDHACEYMTAGAAVILGEVGRNFGAGMTGGVAFVLDEEAALQARLNPDSVAAEALGPPADEWLRLVVQRHADLTASPRARALLARWSEHRHRFVQVTPLQAVAGAASLPALATRPARRGPMAVLAALRANLGGLGGAPDSLRRA
jgi:glutamate synthase domain-containing protein 2/glutamate synthase domain-containing protein 1/glutamate synthase domain-containing protein 3